MWQSCVDYSLYSPLPPILTIPDYSSSFLLPLTLHLSISSSHALLIAS